MIAIRNNSVALGRGGMQFLYPSNRKVLAWIREFEASASSACQPVTGTQAVQLDLSGLRSAVPIELTGGSEFPAIGELPYLLTLPSYGFYWFSLSAANTGSIGPQPELPELFTLVLTGGIETLMAGRERTPSSAPSPPIHRDPPLVRRQGLADQVGASHRQRGPQGQHRRGEVPSAPRRGSSLYG